MFDGHDQTGVADDWIVDTNTRSVEVSIVTAWTRHALSGSFGQFAQDILGDRPDGGGKGRLVECEAEDRRGAGE